MLAWIFAKGIVPLIELPVSQPEGILHSPPGSPAASESCRVDTGNLLRTKDFLAIKHYFSGALRGGEPAVWAPQCQKLLWIF